MWPTMMAGPSCPGVGAPVYQPAGNAAGGTCSDPSASRPRSISVLSTPIDGTCTRTGADLLIGFATGRFARSAAVATADGTSGADGRMETIGESDTGADAGADDTGADAIADDGTGATDGATADFVALDVAHPVTKTAAIAATATPVAMRALVRAPAVRAIAVALIVADGDGGRALMRSRWHPQCRVRTWRFQR